MIDASGTVTALDGDSVIVRMDEAGCGRCHEAGGCGGHNIGQMLCNSPRSFRLSNPGNAQVGDHVTLVVAEGSVRRGALLAYGMPLLALFIGALGGSALAGEAGAIIGAVGGLLCAWLILRYIQAKGKADPVYSPRIKTH